MRVERIIPGEYRVQLDHMVGEYIWIFRRGRKWEWTVGGYGGYNEWLMGANGPFASKKEAIKDVIATYKN